MVKMAIRERAAALRKGFARIPGRETYEATTPEADQLAQKVHRELDLWPLPNDWVFAEIVRGLERVEEVGEDAPDVYDVEPDVYTSDLLAWLRTYPHAVAAVDEAREIMGFGGSVMDEIAAGQEMVRRRILDLVLEFLGSPSRPASGDP